MVAGTLELTATGIAPESALLRVPTPDSLLNPPRYRGVPGGGGKGRRKEEMWGTRFTVLCGIAGLYVIIDEALTSFQMHTHSPRAVTFYEIVLRLSAVGHR